MRPPPAGLDRLRNLLTAPAARAGEGCGFCNLPVGEPHSHLVDLHSRALVCVCRACGLLFAPDGARQGRYRLVPERCVEVAGVAGPAWDLFDIPVGIAFFFLNSSLGRMVAMYPSPAGATESLVPLDTWSDIVSCHPALSTLVPDVEALLVRRTRSDQESYIVPIDVCYELVGLMRKHWKGFDGGQDAAAAVEGFFDRVRQRSRNGSGVGVP